VRLCTNWYTSDSARKMFSVSAQIKSGSALSSAQTICGSAFAASVARYRQILFK